MTVWQCDSVTLDLFIEDNLKGTFFKLFLGIKKLKKKEEKNLVFPEPAYDLLYD